MATDNGVLTQPSTETKVKFMTLKDLVNQYQELLGQLAADALIQDALLIALMEIQPDIYPRVMAKVAATAPGVRLGLPPVVQASFDSRRQERAQFFRDVQTP